MKDSRPSVSVSHQVPALPQAVFDAWLNPAMVWRWMGSVVGEVILAEVTPHVGGDIRYIVRRAGHTIEHIGEFTHLASPLRVQYSWAIPSFSKDVSLVTIDFAPREGGTAISLVQEHLQRELAGHVSDVRAGWLAILGAVAHGLDGGGA